MARKIEAYVDTSALIAFVDRSDTYHPLFRRLFAEPPSLATTPLVIAEGHGWFLKRYDRTRALQFMALVEAMEPLQILPAGEDEQAGGLSMLRRYRDQDLSLTDAVGLHLMKKLKVARCWSTDFHLGLAGARLAINEH
jgi:predicted nucleic acid-binding protein